MEFSNRKCVYITLVCKNKEGIVESHEGEKDLTEIDPDKYNLIVCQRVCYSTEKGRNPKCVGV